MQYLRWGTNEKSSSRDAVHISPLIHLVPQATMLILLKQFNILFLDQVYLLYHLTITMLITY